MRIATYNIRTVRALDRASCWWRRRHRLAEVIRSIDADLWGMQEAWRNQINWLRRTTLSNGWAHLGDGRGRRGGNEACPLWIRTDHLTVVDAATRWYGATPDRPGTRLAGAGFPRVATIVELARLDTGDTFVVANTHLDDRSAHRRRVSLEQLAYWLRTEHPDRPTIVMGDLNCTLDEPPIQPLLELGLRPVLSPRDGPTSNGFGREEHQRQIDHIFASPRWNLTQATIRREADHPSDHWPVIAELQLDVHTRSCS